MGPRLGFFRSGAKVWLYAVADDAPCRWLNGITPQYVQVDVHRDGRLLVTLSDDGAHLWDLWSGNELLRLPAGEVYGGMFEPRSGDLILSENVGLRRWPILSRPGERGETSVRVGPPRPLMAQGVKGAKWLYLSADGRYLGAVVRDQEHYAAVIEIDSGALITRTPGSLPHLSIASVSPGGTWLVTTEFQGGPVKIWDGKRGSLVATLPERLARVSFTPDGKWMAVSGESAGYLLEVATWKRGPALFEEGLRAVPASLAISADGRLLALGESNGRVKLLGLTAGEELATLDLSQPDPVSVGCFSPDGRYYVSSGFMRVMIWDLHAFRRRLRPLGLDWESAPPPEEAEEAAPPLRVELEDGPAK
jgi:WD40 repeat protein